LLPKQKAIFVLFFEVKKNSAKSCEQLTDGMREWAQIDPII